jgi:hypothetical protein
MRQERASPGDTTLLGRCEVSRRVLRSDLLLSKLRADRDWSTAAFTVDWHLDDRDAPSATAGTTACPGRPPAHDVPDLLQAGGVKRFLTMAGSCCHTAALLAA